MRKRARTIDPKPWAFPERPRVLIEHADPDAGLELAGAISRAGCSVGICRGPDAGADPPIKCPVHGFEPCAVVEGADVVVTALDFDRADAREVVHGLRLRYASRPLVVLATEEQAAELNETLEGCLVLPPDAPSERVTGAVLASLPAALRPTIPA